MRKKIQKISKTVTIKCPNCSDSFRIKNPKECLYSIECKKCDQKIEAPRMKCCIVCAYADTQCIPNLLREASRKGLEVRGLEL